VWGGGPGVKPVGLPLLVWFVVVYLNINKVSLPTLVVALSRILTNRTWLDLAWATRFGGPANPYLFFKNQIRVVIVLLVPATWKPLIGPCGSLPFGHTIYCHVSATSSYGLSTHHAMSLYEPYRLPRGTILLVHRSSESAKTG
jgi:hypothetical protein